MATAPNSREHAALRWGGLLARHKTSGMSVGKFCRQESLTEASFYYWRKRLGSARSQTSPVARSMPAGFVDLGLIGNGAARTEIFRGARDSRDAGAGAVEIRLELGAGIVLHVRRS